MFDWLFEGRTNVYAILVALTVFLLLAWWQMRKRWLLAGVVIVVASIGLYALLDKLIETDREQIVRKVNAIADDLNARRLDAAFSNFSDQFRSPGGKSKSELRTAAQSYLDRGEVVSVQVWDIQIEGRPSRQESQVHVFFSAKAKNGREFLTDCDAVFEFHSEHGWQMRSFRLLKPQTTEEWNWQI